MKLFFGFLAYIAIVVVILVIGDISLRFFHIHFPAIDVFLGAGIIFLLIVIINMYNEMQLIKQSVMDLQSVIDELHNKSELTRD